MNHQFVNSQVETNSRTRSNSDQNVNEERWKGMDTIWYRLGKFKKSKNWLEVVNLRRKNQCLLVKRIGKDHQGTIKFFQLQLISYLAQKTP